ncbi:MAG: redoxin domain-containing protein, partial [Bacteroidales bacterium]|nr:redoxin domain-containing protein [Bacteroidales bacterium]
MNKKSLFLTLILSFIIFISFAGNNTETTNPPQQKKMWAKSFLGQKAPTLEVEGWIQKPGSTDGKYVLVDIWATWCGPCRKAIPELNEWQQKYANKLVIIGISSETKEKVEEYAKENIKYANGFDTKSRVKIALKVTGIPH